MERLSQNPLVTPADIKPTRDDYEIIGTFNAGATRCDGEVILLIRVAERPRKRMEHGVCAPIYNPETGTIEALEIPYTDPGLKVDDERVFRYYGQFHTTSVSHLRVARSRDGINFTCDSEPALMPADETETFGLEDPRITRMGEDYWITYKAVSEYGVTTALAHTRDFKHFTRHGVILCPENLDVVIFPERFGGDYFAWTRPVGVHAGPPTIWSARSPDLINWGHHRPALRPRRGHWDSGRVGASCVPFRCDEGWISIYHGADHSNRYCIGVALLDGDDPRKELKRSDAPLMQPEAPYELEGFFGGVVFPCGAIVEDDGQVLIYYGAADERTCAVRTSVSDLLEHVHG
jgi:predicted GH43/DUF377 family glycosyl hydrolase